MRSGKRFDGFDADDEPGSINPLQEEFQFLHDQILFASNPGLKRHAGFCGFAIRRNGHSDVKEFDAQTAHERPCTGGSLSDLVPTVKGVPPAAGTSTLISTSEAKKLASFC